MDEPASQPVPRFASVVVNPRAGRGSVGRELPTVEEALRRERFEVRVAVASGPQEAAALAREALDRGERFIVAVGGNGTVAGVVNGLLEDGRAVAPDAILAAVSAGSGNDVVRSFGLPQDPVEAVARFAVARAYPIDAGRATVETRRGRRTRHFLGMAQVGLWGAAAARAARLPAWLGRGRPFLGYWAALATSPRRRVRIAGDRREFEGRVTNVVVANLQFTGDGLLVAPRAWPEDGHFDLQIYTGPRSDSFTMLPGMFRGEHVPSPNILEYRSTTVRIESDRPVHVQTDGEPLGRTPATFEIVPKAVRLLV